MKTPTKKMELFKVTLALFLWADYAHVGGHGLCPASFHGSCDCVTDSNYIVVNCTNTNLDNANILEYIPVDTGVLIFTGNNVPDLPLYVFGMDANYVKMVAVDLSNNGIQTIKDRTFHGVTSVKKLLLNDNDLYLNGKDNQPEMFRSFGNLEELHLVNTFTEKLTWREYAENLAAVFSRSRLLSLRLLNLERNEIDSLTDRDFFRDLPSLRELRLSGNRLYEFRMDFNRLPHLHILDLSRNRISYLINETLSDIEASSSDLKINMSGNPFRCDCDMMEFYVWMIGTEKTELLSKDDYYCKDGFPPRNIGRLLSNITANDLLCPYYSHDFYTDLKAIYIVLTLIIIAMVALVITIVIYKSKRYVYHVAHRMSVNIRRKFQYDSLDKVEETEMEV